jgi:hypothetical protein
MAEVGYTEIPDDAMAAWDAGHQYAPLDEADVETATMVDLDEMSDFVQSRTRKAPDTPDESKRLKQSAPIVSEEEEGPTMTTDEIASLIKSMEATSLEISFKPDRHRAYKKRSALAVNKSLVLTVSVNRRLSVHDTASSAGRVYLKRSAEWNITPGDIPLISWLVGHRVSIVSSLGEYGEWDTATGELIREVSFKTDAEVPHVQEMDAAAAAPARVCVVPRAMISLPSGNIIVSHQPSPDYSVVHVCSPTGEFHHVGTGLINIRSFCQGIDDGAVWGVSSVGPFHILERLPYTCWALVTPNLIYNAHAQLDDELVREKVTNHMYEVYIQDVVKEGMTEAWTERLSKQAELVNQLVYPPLDTDFTFIDARTNNEIVTVSNTGVSYYNNGRQVLMNVSVHMVYMAKFIGDGDIALYHTDLTLSRMRLNAAGDQFELASNPMKLHKEKVLGVTSWPYECMLSLLSGTKGRVVTFQGDTIDFAIPSSRRLAIEAPPPTSTSSSDTADTVLGSNP